MRTVFVSVKGYCNEQPSNKKGDECWQAVVHTTELLFSQANFQEFQMTTENLKFFQLLGMNLSPEKLV
jgi:hypothetical protein